MKHESEPLTNRPSFTLTTSDLQSLDKLAFFLHLRGRSEVVRFLIRQAMKKNKKRISAESEQ